MLRVSELFTSIQGEGIWVGVPSIFLRVSGCNLRCVWCDTPYASWEPEGDHREASDIFEEIAANPVAHIVITGGEPLLFDEVGGLAAKMKDVGKVITFETAGTIFRDWPCDLMSISPKLSNSTPPPETPNQWSERHEERRLNIEVLNQLLATHQCQLKFVVNPDSDLKDIPEIEELLSKLTALPQQILLMAEGTDRETLNRRMTLLSPVCIERGWRLSPRLHIDLFGDTKGT